MNKLEEYTIDWNQFDTQNKINFYNLKLKGDYFEYVIDTDELQEIDERWEKICDWLDTNFNKTKYVKEYQKIIEKEKFIIDEKLVEWNLISNNDLEFESILTINDKVFDKIKNETTKSKIQKLKEETIKELISKLKKDGFEIEDETITTSYKKQKELNQKYENLL